MGVFSKGSGRGASKKEEEKNEMKLVTRFELAAYSTAELHGLYQAILNSLYQSEQDQMQRAKKLANLENIVRELACRCP